MSLWNSLSKLDSKKRKLDDLEKEDNIPYVSATGTKNYLMKDPLLDWLDLYYDKHDSIKKELYNNSSSKKRKINNNININNISSPNSNQILFDKGNLFEAKIFEYLNHNYKNQIEIVNITGQFGCNINNYDKTVEHMKNGVPIILQGVLINKENKTRGTADIIIRSDYINRLVKRQVLTPEEEIFKADNLNGNYHYRVIDIKWTDMTLCANGFTIRNEGRFPCYKAQLAIYNYIVGKIQGFIPNQTYIMSKSWKIDSKKNYSEGYSCFDLLGVIDYSNFDAKYIDMTCDALRWARDVRLNGSNWNPLKPEREEMYPNMSNYNDAPWTEVKKKIADNINEITQIWFVNDKHRKNAHEKNIMSWKDERCNSDTLGITGDIKTSTIDAILDVNREKELKIIPDIIENNLMNWQIPSVDFYVDFETVSEYLYTNDMDLNNSKCVSDMIFMIGVGYIVDNKWNYKVFVMNDISLNEEQRIIDEFTQFILQKSLELDKNTEYFPRLFHWSNAEISNFTHANERHDNKWKRWNKDIMWVDMYSVFISEPITVKGALNFKLKSIGKAFFNLKYINTLWDDDGPKDGLGAMLSSINYFKDKKKGTNSEQVLKSITNYNEVDCKVIWEIVSYLRDNHCDPNKFKYDFTIRY